MKKFLCLTLCFLLAVLITPVNAALDIFYIKKINDRVVYNKNSWPNSSCASEDNISKVINDKLNPENVPYIAYIAAGDYKVTQTINLKVGVKLYGGFADDNSENTPEERRFNGVTSLDAKGHCRVIKCESNVMDRDSDSTRLDGFVITGGRIDDDRGGGMYNNQTSPTIVNCTFIKNMLTNNNNSANGGGIYNRNSEAKIINCSFIENSAYYDGGAIYNDYANVTIINCTFKQNKIIGSSNGGAIYNTGEKMRLINCSFIANSAVKTSSGSKYHGGAIYNSNADLAIKNCTFINNISTNSGSEIFNNNSSSTTILNHEIINTIIFHNNDNQSGIYNNNYENIINFKNCAINASIENGTVQSSDTIILTSTDINMSDITDERGSCGVVQTVLKFDKHSQFVNSGTSHDISFDQLGNQRGLKFDIGSFEYQPSSATEILSSDFNSAVLTSPDILAGQSFDVTLNDIADKWDMTGTLPEWFEFEQLSPLKGRFKIIDTPVNGTFTIFMNLLNSKGSNERSFTITIGNSAADDDDNNNDDENDENNNNEDDNGGNGGNSGDSGNNDDNDKNAEDNKGNDENNNNGNNGNGENENAEDSGENKDTGSEEDENDEDKSDEDKNINDENGNNDDEKDSNETNENVSKIIYDDDEYKIFNCGINSYPLIVQLAVLFMPLCIKKF